ncbi:MAG TPA: HAD-IC family P-type ATPase [Actinomycetaceae bacterium]|nr:HAD-IC family P-type ATPase [Actinomycetaceae bacterium]
MSVTGLTDAEARARLAAGQSNQTHLRPARTAEIARRESVFTIFHLNMLGLIGIQLLMRANLSALITFGLGLLTILIRIVQDSFSERRLRALQHEMRPRSNVIRGGHYRSIDSDQIVPGDLIVVGPGDQFQVDGRVVGSGAVMVDASQVTGERGWQRVEAGGEVFAGSTCISGRGRYVAERVGSDRLVHARMSERTTAAAAPTPLERLVARVLLYLLIVVIVFVAILLAKFFRLDVGDAGEALIDAAPVIFSLLPTGLYLMIVRTYATGTADLARAGAVVHSARTVESLAESDIICFTDVEVLAGTAAEITPLPGPPDDDDWPSPPQMRQLLGDIARNVAVTTPLSEAFSRTFEGEERTVRLEVSQLANLGWLAIAFDDDSGLYVLASPRVLVPHLREPGAAALDAVISDLGRATASDDDVATEVLVLAWGPLDRAVPDAVEMRLPDGLVPLCVVSARRRLHSEAMEVIREFVASGVRIKVFSAGEPEEVIALLHQSGLTTDDEQQLLAEGGLSRETLESVPREEWPELVAKYRLFGGLRPEQVAEVVRVLRAGGKHVTVVGDGLTDLPALQGADIAVVHPSSTQAALSQADIVVLDQSPAVLLKALHEGQSMVRGLLDLLKLNLTLVICSALLILGVRLFGVGFPYRGGHGSIISILAITIPSILMPLWARTGRIESADYRRILARFVAPAGVLLAAAAFLIYLYFLNRTGSVATAQMAVTYTLLYCGLTLAVIIQPPVLVDGKRRWNTVAMAGILAVLGTFVPYAPKGLDWFQASMLPHPGDYLVVAGAVGLWALALLGIWRIWPRVE